MQYHPVGNDQTGFFELPPDERTRVCAILDVFAAVDAAPHKARMATWDAAVRTANATLAAAGLAPGLTVKRLTNLRTVFRKNGNDWSACIDTRRVRDWSVAERRRVDEVPEATVIWWKSLIEQFKGRQNCMNQAYQRAIEAWRHGMPIAGYEQRPPSTDDGYPAGWSYSNFCRLCKRTKFEKIRGHTGAKAASNFAFHVPSTRVGIEVGQFYMLDDVWHDFRVKPTLKSPPMRLLELCALDLRSGKRVCYGLKPETLDDETGARVRLQGRDMRFLVAALFSLYGYRTQGTWLIGENATAVVPDDIRATLDRATDGAIKFRASAIRDTPAFPGWYRARGGGSPRFKAALESRFNLDHNAEAMLIGQVGSNERVNAPEELHGRKDADKALVKALGGLQLRPEDEMLLRGPFLPFVTASRIVHAIYACLDGRTEHHLEGWEPSGLVTGEVRLDPRQPDWTPLYALAVQTPEQQAAMADLMQVPGCYRLRKLSPTEVWEQDCRGLTRLPAHVLPAIIGRDLATERKVNDHGSFSFQDSSIWPEPLRYVGIAVDPRGREIMLREGETYLTFCNPFDPRYLLVSDAKGAYVGRCCRVERACRADDEALAMAMGQAAHVNALRARAFIARNVDRVDDRMGDDAANAAIVSRALPAPAIEQERRVTETYDRISGAGNLEDIYGDAVRRDTDLAADEQLDAADSVAALL